MKVWLNLKAMWRPSFYDPSFLFCPSFLLVPSSLPSSALQDSNWPDHLLLVVTVHWRDCDWKVRLLTSAYREWWSLALRGYEDTEHTKHNYTHSVDTQENKHLTHFSPAPLLFPHSPSSEPTFSRTALGSIEGHSFFLFFFVCSWLVICLEMKSLAGFPGCWMGLKDCKDQEKRRSNDGREVKTQWSCPQNSHTQIFVLIRG